MMVKICILFFLSLSLYAGEVVWSSGASQSVSDAEYNKAIKEYVAQKYPKELEAWEKDIDAKSVTFGDLMWQDDEDTKTVQKKWDDAQRYCNNLQPLGFNDWRLPTKSELESIVDKSREPAIKEEFKNCSSSGYWSSTTNEYGKYNAWIVNFYNGYVYSSNKDLNYYVRCVRAGQ